MGKEIAILMAAGMGTRLKPITENIAKPLVNVNGKAMIETVIDALQKRNIEKIYVVTGYKSKQFEYLKKKYNNLSLIKNEEYLIKNNISSIYAARDILGTEDCFILEADLVVLDESIFEKKLDSSCYYGKFVEGKTDDWVFYVNGTKIVKIGKGGNNLYNMVGVSYFKKQDASILKDAILEAYEGKGYEQMFWDEIVDKILNKINVKIEPIKANQIIEIDTFEELKVVDSSYINKKQ